MQKKNSLFIDFESCKIQENIIYEHYREDFLTVIERFNDFNTTDSNTELDNYFYKELYVPSRTLRSSDNVREKEFYDININEIGNEEWQTIMFSTGFGDTFKNHRIIFIKGNVGSGKSSLVNYVFKYLYSSKKSIKEKILPFVYNCQGYKNELIDKKSISDKIDGFIRNKLINSILDIIRLDNEDFWDWYEQKLFPTNYSDNIRDIKLLYADNKEILKRRYTEKGNDKFPYYASYYITEVKKKEIVIVLDNIDPFDIQRIKDFYWKAKEIMNISRIKIIISLRPSTYTKLQNEINNISKVRYIEIEPNLLKILETRLDYLALKIKTNKKNPLKITLKGNTKLSTTQNAFEAIKKIINAIMSDIGRECIINFSNKNIRDQLEILRIIFSSGFLSTSEIGKLLMSDNSKINIPPELIISTITTFGYCAYSSEKAKEMNVPGLLNVLSSSNHSSPIPIFSKLYILNYLLINGKMESFKKNDIINRFEKYTEYMSDRKELVKSFKYSFYRLFSKGLIESPDMHTSMSKEDFFDNVIDVSISNLGKYYFNQLIINPYYLIFIKDDIYVNDINKYKSVIAIKKEYDGKRLFWVNFHHTVKFLREYGNLELEAIEKFIDFNTFEQFNASFCHNKGLFTIHILENMLSYVNDKSLQTKISHEFQNKHQIFNAQDISEIKTIKDELINKYNKLVKNEL